MMKPTSLTVLADSPATPIGIASPSGGWADSVLGILILTVPTNGSVTLAGGLGQVAAGETLTVGQLTGLEFIPTPGTYAERSALKYRILTRIGRETGHATLTIGSHASVAASAPASPIAATAAPATAGPVHSDVQPASSVRGPSHVVAASVVNPAVGLTTPSVAVPSASSATLVASPASLTVPNNSAATPTGVQAPTNATHATPAPAVTADTLANGVTPVGPSQTSSAAPLTALRVAPTQGVTVRSSSVASPGGQSATGVATPTTATPTTGLSRIALENQKQGTPESVWQLPNGIDSTNIEGFTTQISTDVGQTVSFKINTSAAHYRIDIYRLGYYGGNGARLVTSIDQNLSTAQGQPAALRDAATGLVDAGNWNVSASWAVPADAVSGVYVANLVREDGTAGMSQIPFVVRDDALHSDIVFQTNDQTWQAYNGWGGANTYGGNGPGVNGAAYAVSYNRPIITGDPNGGYEAGPHDTLMGVEYSTIQWMEQNGYDVSYISGVDASNNGALLLNHKVYMDAGHDEYWTGSQRANVQAAVDHGVNLAFLSGNEMYWKTQLAPSIDASGTANRTLVAYKDTHYNAVINPTGVWTGTWEDPRFTAALPANQLTGTVFQVDSYRQDTLAIPYPMTQLRVWRNTAVATTQLGQTASLAPGLLGYEWDSSPDNGFRPAGLIDLSSTTLAVGTSLLDYGNATGNGTATHNLVEYRDPLSGALVFGAGTVFWSWGLSADHLFGQSASVPVDPSVQQATVNFLADMGVQPSTLQSTLAVAAASLDHTPPISVISGMSGTSVVEGQRVTVTGTASDVGGVVAGVEVSSDGGLTWHPATGTNAWSYVFTTAAPGAYAVKSRATDDSLNTETPGQGAAYTVAISPALSLFGPTDTPGATVADASSAELGMKFVSATNGEITGFRFYKSAQDIGSHTGHLWNAAGTLLAAATFVNETASGWQQVDLATPVKIAAGTPYVVSYHTAGQAYVANSYYFDNQGHTTGSLTASGNGLNGLYSYGAGAIFPVTASAANYWADVVFKDTSQGPQANGVNGLMVTENTALTIPVATLLANDTDSGGYALSVTGVSNPSHGVVSYDAAAQTVTFAPTAGYAGQAGFAYSITDGHGGSASGHAGMTVNYPVTAQSLFFTGDTPVNPVVNDPLSVELGVKFKASVSGAITGLRFYKGASNTGPHVADLWSSTGNLLATAAFAGESASGWQQVNFVNAVAIIAGVTYTASYHSGGNYSADSSYFATAHVNGQLTALDSASAGGNGVYAYGSASLFPTSSYNAANYWVDVVFRGASLAVVANNDSFTTPENNTLVLSAAALLANDTDPYGYPLAVTAVGSPSHGVVSYDAGSQTVSFTPTAGYTGPAGFAYTVGDGHGGVASASVALTINAAPQIVAGNDSGFVATGNGALAISAAALLANDTDSAGYALSIAAVGSPSHGTVSYDATAQTVTFAPTVGYAGPASFTYSVTDGHGGSASANVGLTVDYPVTAQSLFLTGDAPAVMTVNDPSSVELGVKFQASANGAITGLRFYKGASNTGPHVADLWSSTGTLLATAAFTSESAAGWQQVNFVNPVAIVAGVTYTASYHTNGNYSADGKYFATAHTDQQLTALSDASGGGNGVYAYGSNPLFPSSSYNGTNYWVDVVFSGVTLAPTPANDRFAATEGNTLTLSAAALLANDTDPYGYPLAITAVGSPTNGVVSYDAGSQTVSFIPTAGYTGPAGFAYTVSNGHGGVASANVALTINAAPSPVANSDGGLLATENAALTLPVSVLLANDTDPSGYALSVTGVSLPSHGVVSYDATARTVTFVPTSGYTGAAGFTYSITDGHGGVASGNVAVTVEPPSTTTLFSASATPATVTVNEQQPLELGVKFQASVGGIISGLMFYKGPTNTGPHVADLWSGTGSLLATAAFTSETLSGWQLVSFAAPVSIAAGVTYVASYHTSGSYSADSNYFATAYTHGPLTAVASSSNGGNGVYSYGGTSVFPSSTYGATNYWVDVVFTSGALTAVADAGTTNQNTILAVPATAGLLANDTDTIPGATMAVAAVNGVAGNIGAQIALASGALLKVNADGSYSYDPNGKFSTLPSGQSATDSFSYTVKDSQGATSSATDTVTVKGQAPLSIGFTLSTALAGLDPAGQLSGGYAVGTFQQAGGIAGDFDIYSLAAGSASQFSVSSAGVLTTNAMVPGSAAGTIYTLNVKVQDATVGASTTRAYHVVVGNDLANTINVADGVPTVAFGLAGSDTLDGGSDTVPLWLIAGGSGSSLRGGAGNDTLVGGGGGDSMSGGGGANTFIFNAASDSPLAHPDTITDFMHGLDLIDVTSVTGLNATQGAFQGQIASLITAHGFGWSQNGADTDLFFNTGSAPVGSAAAQMEIVLKGVAGSTLTGVDFRHG